MIKWSAVTKQYGGIQALSGLDIEVSPGEIFGFLGPNGAGKTTALKIAVGLVRPDSGEVTLDGVPAGNPSSRRSLGYLPEEIPLPPRIRLREWLRYQVALRNGDVSSIESAAERVGLADRLGDPAGSLSKGMKRRTGLLLLLAMRPGIWLLDEPTADLDVAGRELVENVLLQARREGATLFLSSHILSEVERVCDRIGVIEKGALRICAPPADLLPAPFILDLSFDQWPEDLDRSLAGREAVITPESGRVRVFVSDRQDGDRVIQSLEQSGRAIRQSSFRPASLRDAMGRILK